MARDEALEVLSVLSDSPHRLSILEHVGEEPTGVADVSDTLDIPRATAKHNLKRLEERELVRSVGSRYTISTFGLHVRASVTDCLDRTAVSRQLLPFLRVVPDSSFEPDLALFDDSTVTTISSTNPHAPVERLLEFARAGDYLRVVTPVVLPRLVTAIHERVVEDGHCVDLVVSADALDVLQGTTEYETAVETGRLIVGVSADPIPFGLFLLEDRLALAGHDEQNILRCLVENDAREALAWANERFREFEQSVESHVFDDGTVR